MHYSNLIFLLNNIISSLGKKKKDEKKQEKKEKPKKEKEPEEELDAADAALAAEPKSKDPFDAMPKGYVHFRITIKNIQVL